MDVLPNAFREMNIRMTMFGAVGSLLGLYILQWTNYLLFHSVAEIFSIVIGYGVFLVAWNARHRMDNDFLVFLGIAYAFIASIDVVHMLSYKGMGVFAGFGPNLPTQLWIGARYLEASSWLIGGSIIHTSLLSSTGTSWRRFVNRRSVILAYFGITGLLFLAIFRGMFPDAFVPGEGLTTFKIVSEYLIILILVVSLMGLVKERAAFSVWVFRLLALSIVFTIASEMAFTAYIDVYGFSNMVGHMFKIGSFYVIYVAVIKTGITDPHTILFRELQTERDALADREEALRQKNERLDQFASIVSHDLRNPLTVAKGRVELARETNSDENLVHASTALDRMDTLIEDLLVLARQGDLIDETRMVRLSTVVRKYWQMIPDQNATLVFDSDIVFRADANRLQQLFENLFRNAIDHAGSDVTVEIGALGETGFYVEDDGPGIREEHHEHVFDSGYSTIDEGTGFGLAIVSEIVDAHDWEIHLSESERGGARFEITGLEPADT